MTIKQFMRHSGAPISLDEIAERAEHVDDDPALQDAAALYLIAKVQLEEELERIGFEIG